MGQNFKCKRRFKQICCMYTTTGKRLPLSKKYQKASEQFQGISKYFQKVVYFSMNLMLRDTENNFLSKISHSAFLIAVKFWKIPRNLKFAKFVSSGDIGTFYTCASRWSFPTWWQLHHKSYNLTQDPLNRGCARCLFNYVCENMLNTHTVPKYMPDIFTLNTKAQKRNERHGRVSQVECQDRY